MTLKERALKLHAENRGKIEIALKIPLETKEDMTLAYTPGVAEPCLEIAKDAEAVYTYTNKGNLVAVVTDGSAVLGLGNIGAAAGYPVMEGKAALFKRFAGIDAVPICLKTQDVEELVTTIKNLEPTFGGINLEDISAPRCFEVERRLIELMNIPVFHDDQHGTAIVVLAGLINALKVVKKEMKEVRIVLNGAGAAGTAVSSILASYGARDIVVCDSRGILHTDRGDLNEAKADLAARTNPRGVRGTISDALRGADVCIGISGPNTITADMIRAMHAGAIVMAMANPVPEIMPDVAREAGAAVVATGRSDFPNQINNVLAFPGIFRAALDLRIRSITTEMKIAAAEAIASVVSDSERSAEYIIPKSFDDRVVPAIVEQIRQITERK